MKTSRGFSLLELTIVVTIIGTLISLIITATNFLKEAQIRAVITEFAQLQQTILTFEKRYNALPGDFSLAHTSFGTDCSSVASECNGNGNGIIEWSASLNDVESLRAWQHLHLARLYNIYLPGVATVAGQSNIGTNIPSSTWPSAGLELFANATTSSGSTGNAILLAGFTASNSAQAPIMSPQQAWAIDKKVDDGLGQRGRIMGFGTGTSSTCVGTDNLTYNTSLTTKVCYLKYLLYPNLN
jgi:prepilin-type N-terminal cleavage/methylation domain-containing protein